MDIRKIKDSIYYIEVIDNEVIAHTDTFSYKIKNNFNKLIDILGSDYKYAHVNCIVNHSYVEEYDYINGYFKLINGEIVNLLLKKYNIPEI